MDSTLVETPGPALPLAGRAPDVANAAAQTSATRWRAWRLVLVVVLAVVGLNLLALLLRPVTLWVNFLRLQQTAEKIVLYQQGPRPDVVFMGTSRAFQAFDPDVFNDELQQLTGREVKALNMATASGTLEINYLELKNIISDQKKPSVIVYGLSEFEFQVSGRWNMLRDPRYGYLLLAWSDMLSPFSGTTALDKAYFVVQQACPLCRDRELIRNALNIAFNPDYPGHNEFVKPVAQMHIDTGFWAAPPGAPMQKVDEEKQRKDFQASLKTFRPTPGSLEMLSDFLALAQERSIQVVLVNLPVSQGLLDSFASPEDVAAYTASIRRVADEYGAPLLDLYSEGHEYLAAQLAGSTKWGPPIPPTEAQVTPSPGFIDLHHLNAAGADVVTRLVTRQYLAEYFKAGGAPGR